MNSQAYKYYSNKATFIHTHYTLTDLYSTIRHKEPPTAQ